MQEFLQWPFELPPVLRTVLFGGLGAFLTYGMTRLAFASCREPDRGWSKRTALAGAVLCGLFAWWWLATNCQQTPMVRPENSLWWFWRVGYQIILIALMLAATSTDMRAYFIPDAVTTTGLVLGVGLAVLSGQLQIQHVWIDWNQQVPQLHPPYVPNWVDAHRHWHGFAVSLAGAGAGAGGIMLVRTLSSKLLGQETMGLGDVTLMGMIGSYLGWQPVTFVLMLAPLCALTWHASAGTCRWGRRLWLGRHEPADSPHFIPYGPFLCAATYVVLMTWRWIWMFDPDDRVTTFTVRGLFGDWQGLLIIVGATLGSLVALLVLRRAYSAIPVTGRSGVAAEQTPPSSPKADSACLAASPGDDCTQRTDHTPPGDGPPFESRGPGQLG